jgi:hypothetical protein
MKRIIPSALLSILFVINAWCADPFYQGTWKIESATVAPWWTDAKQKPDAAESKALVGQNIVISAKAINGPRQVACKDAHYTQKSYTADMLFQGMFGEMHDRDKTVDPAKVAAAAGFKGASWKTIETGCEIDFHFIDDRTAAIGLNNYIYKLQKQ